MDLVKACQQVIGQEAEELQDALIYLDEGAAEAFHFVGGLSFFLQLGVRAVCSLEQANSVDAAITWNVASLGLARKIVIITGQILSDVHRQILLCLRAHRSIQHYLIFTSISEEGHSACPGTPLGTDAYSEYRDLLLQDLLASNEENLDFLERRESLEPSSSPMVTVRHLPLIFCPLTPKIFVLPSGATIAAAALGGKHENSLATGIPGYHSQYEEDQVPFGALLHAHFLHNLGSQLDLKFDIFSLGSLAHVVGKQLTEFSSLADGVGRGRQPAGLLLLDRSLDLITPSSHGDSLVDRIYACLPRQRAFETVTNKQSASSISRLSMDVRIPSSLDGMSGSISTAWEFEEFDRLDALFEKRTKEGTVLVRKWLQEALRQHRIEIPGRGRLGSVTASELQCLIEALNSDPCAAIKCVGLIQLAKACAEILEAEAASKWDAFASAEKILGISAADQSLALQVRDLVKQSSGVLSLKDAMTVALVAYGLGGEYGRGSTNSGGPFSWEEEHALKEAIADVILKGGYGEDLDFLGGLASALEKHWKTSEGGGGGGGGGGDDWGDDDQWEKWDESEEGNDEEVQLKLELNDRLEDVFRVLHKVANARCNHQLRRGGDEESGVFRGLIHEVLSLVFSKAEVPGLKHHASTVGRFLKSGFGRFGLKQVKSRLGEHKILVVFVIGGLNGAEIREARMLNAAAVAGSGVEEVLIGGTTLLTADDMHHLLLASS